MVGRGSRLCAMVLAMLVFSAPVSAQGWGGGWQCVTFARAFSGIELFGNAATWWHQAVGQYEQGIAPRVGSVLVFKPFAHMRVGHVATVSEVISPREIKVTHANWSPVAGRRGQVEENVTVVDTSAAGDWSRVRVWYAPMGDLGTTDYPVYGFIYGHAAKAFETTEHAIAALETLPAELAGL
ncbi:MAG: CHAP domain-containing protein [Sphingomonadaceae bacterium]|nr:CHAP domain-containing protein [Sphingomonadaceae bacterium]